MVRQVPALHPRHAQSGPWGPGPAGRRTARGGALAGAVLTGALVAGLAGCSSQDTSDQASSGSPQPSSSSGSPQASSPPAGQGNGTLFATLWGESETKVTAHPVTSDGALGEGREVVSGGFEGTQFDGVVDGLGDLVLTASFRDYWTTELSLKRGEDTLSTTTAKGWCGGEDLMAICHLLDQERIVRTTVLGSASKDPKVLVSSLGSGETLKEHGPFKDLTMIIPTAAADAILLVTTPADDDGDPSGQGSVQRLDLGSGQTTPLGDVPDGWVPLCAVGGDSVLGYTDVGKEQRASVVGPATIGEVSWSREDTIAGCSADGRFLYVQQVPAPPTEEYDDTEGKNPPSNVERVSLADGQRDAVLTLAGSEVATLVSR